MTAANTVTVLMTAHNAASSIARTLASLQAQTVPADVTLDVIVVDDRSTDDTTAVARQSNPAVRIIRIDDAPPPHSTARQRALDVGVRASAGNVILVLDADAVAPQHWVASMCDALQSARAVGWPIWCEAANASARARWIAMTQTVDHAYYHHVCHMLDRAGAPSGLCFGAAGFWRSSFDAAGGFEGLGFTLVEDLAFARHVHRTGGQVSHPAGRSVRVRGAATLSEIVRRALRVTATGGPSLLAFSIGLWTASWPLAIASGAMGWIPWSAVAARWALGVAFLMLALRRTRSVRSWPAALTYETAAAVLAIPIAIQRLRLEHITWGGLSYSVRGRATQVAP